MKDSVINLEEFSPTIQTVFRKKSCEMRPLLAKLLFFHVFNNRLRIPLYMLLSRFYKAIEVSYYNQSYETDVVYKILSMMHKGVSFEKINLIVEQILIGE